MENSDILFEEKQCLGHNRFSIVIRTVLSLFCFFGYYWSQNPKPIELSFFRISSYPAIFGTSGLIFFIVGVSILLLSAGLTFVLHIQTRVYNGYMVLDGFWTSRKVKIELDHIRSIRKSRYKKNIFRRAVYNLHNLGIIRFYTSGEDFIELVDDAGFTYRIGSQKPQELYNVLSGQVRGEA
ncbi:MAG: hypothetical protein IT236_09915 [Bacteroidia bacterium]|nr:hypothetical protein [Bacteroidia bacterium]